MPPWLPKKMSDRELKLKLSKGMTEELNVKKLLMITKKEDLQEMVKDKLFLI
jgi:hypothetical protein